jgi:hypothetical protein
MRRRRISLLVVIVTVVLTTIGVASAGAASSIEKIWAFGGGEIAIQPEPNGTFVGTVVAETKFAQCVHPVGQVIWKEMRLQPDGSYWGLHQWYFEGTCAENPVLGPTAWRVIDGSGGANALRVCFSKPGTTQPTIPLVGPEANVTYGCVTSAQLAPVPQSTTASFIEKLLHPQCLSGRHFPIHLAEPPHDPFKTVRITLRGHRLPTVHRGHYILATVNLRHLPPGAYIIKVTATTVLGLHLKGSRTYHTCAKKQKHNKPSRLRRT